MSTRSRIQDRTSGQANLDQAITMLSQQVWCWGQDILRPEGNWLTQIGFERITPPAKQSSCSSVYQLALPGKQSVILRGFGALFSDHKLGTVYLPRYTFKPMYAKCSRLKTPPWAVDDLPPMTNPTPKQHEACAVLTLNLIDWIADYETNITQQLGTAYRDATLRNWDSGERIIIPAKKIPAAWRDLSEKFSDDFNVLLTPDEHRPPDRLIA